MACMPICYGDLFECLIWDGIANNVIPDQSAHLGQANLSLCYLIILTCLKILDNTMNGLPFKTFYSCKPISGGGVIEICRQQNQKEQSRR